MRRYCDDDATANERPRERHRSMACRAPGLSTPLVTMSSMTRSTIDTATSSGVGVAPGHGCSAYQCAVTSSTNMPLVERQPSTAMGTPRPPRISISASCQRISESMRSPSMSKMDAANPAGTGCGGVKR